MTFRPLPPLDVIRQEVRFNTADLAKAFAHNDSRVQADFLARVGTMTAAQPPGAPSDWWERQCGSIAREFVNADLHAKHYHGFVVRALRILLEELERDDP